MVDVENHVTFAHVKVPGDDRGGVDDLDQDLVGQEYVFLQTARDGLVQPLGRRSR